MNSKDSQFKRIVESFLGKSSRRTMNGDLEYHRDGFSYVVEYENSSRGLIANATKLALAAEETNIPTRALMIYTDHHRRLHNPDLKRASFLARKLHSDNFKAILICETEIRSTDQFRNLLFRK